MRNIAAIAQREVNAYFASPIAYVLIGFFALLFGWFFYVPLAFFIQQSSQMGMNPTQALNINQMLVGPTLMNTTVIMLFLFPLITMRTYSEEKRSGTIELLLTSPVTDFQIIMGKFLGAMGLYAAMLGVTAGQTGDRPASRRSRPAAAAAVAAVARLVRRSGRAGQVSSAPS